MIIEIKDTKIIENLYSGWTETCVRSCLSGCMGKIYAPDTDEPDCAVAILGDFAFYTGKASKELISYKPQNKQDSHFIIMVGNSKEWDDAIQDYYGDKSELHVRYMIKKDTQFDRDNLYNLKSRLPKEYSTKLIDEELYNYCLKNDWCRDFVSNFRDYDEYRGNGIGVMIMKDNVPAGGASSYSYYPGGIEIEIVTKEEHRRKGLATVCAASLILECLDRGLYPSWDAANLNSVGVSAKLGYEFDKEYNAFHVNW